MELEELTKLRFQSSIDFERPQTRAKITLAADDARRRGIAHSGEAVLTIACLECDGLALALDRMLAELEKDSSALELSDYEVFWRRSSTELKTQLLAESRRRKDHIIQRLSSPGIHKDELERIVGSTFNQQLAELLNRLGRRERELILSQRLRAPKKTPPFVAPESAHVDVHAKEKNNVEQKSRFF